MLTDGSELMAIVTMPRPNWDLDDPDHEPEPSDDDYEYEDTPAVPIYEPEDC